MLVSLFGAVFEDFKTTLGKGAGLFQYSPVELLSNTIKVVSCCSGTILHRDCQSDEGHYIIVRHASACCVHPTRAPLRLFMALLGEGSHVL